MGPIRRGFPSEIRLAPDSLTFLTDLVSEAPHGLRKGWISVHILYPSFPSQYVCLDIFRAEQCQSLVCKHFGSYLHYYLAGPTPLLDANFIMRYSWAVILFFSLWAVPKVNAHGYVNNINVDGKR